jgi:hypothetical protein
MRRAAFLPLFVTALLSSGIRWELCIPADGCDAALVACGGHAHDHEEPEQSGDDEESCVDHPLDPVLGSAPIGFDAPAPSLAPCVVARSAISSTPAAPELPPPGSSPPRVRFLLR